MNSTPTKDSRKLNERYGFISGVAGPIALTVGVQALARLANASEPRQPEPFKTSAAHVSLRKERILLAEDNLVNQQVALGKLCKLGYDADLAASGVEVLNALQSKRYDIILMECQMPDLDGYEVTREIRRRERSGIRTWIIATTANGMVGDREKCLKAGMDDYVSKPLRRTKLKAAMERGAASPANPLDDDALRDLMEDGGDELAELIELFVVSAPRTIADMQRNLKNSNAAHLSMAAHKLKGSCSNFGVSPLRELCAEIEEAGISDDIDCTADLILSAEKELYRLIDALESYRKPRIRQ